MAKWMVVLLVIAGGAGLAGTPAEERIAAVRRAVERDGGNARLHTELAFALARRARETADSGYYDQAEAALKEALRLSPENFAALKVRAWILLGRHEFAEALKLATELNKQVPDDVLVYGLLADAHIEMGNYAEAEKAAQWMLDLRPGNVAGLTRGAYLRELFGDIDGAIEFMNSAYQRTPPNETEDRAWILTQIGHLFLLEGKPDAADRALARALETFPNYHYALANLAQVRQAQGKHGEAVELLRKRYEAARHPENLFDLAAALERAGRSEDARIAFAEFEQAARREMEGWDNANRELILYYTDHAGRPEEALRIAGREIGRRRDVHTLDAYAWALHRNQRHAEARKQIEAALAVGVKDPKILRHAEEIRRAGGGELAAGQQ